ncbi:ATP-binding protein [Pseudoalteromonas sp. DL2-H2.2]|uniref:sensor histidine kinase n=1 Tax=Pseudoalteromonas sp. DL2-H2.2 TaxID=2908889 RepID=UPI001F2057D4|nr:ATP-binding protein [Pseudoalteromonas sp. DL2-H2.2]MCF2909259.1 ATP-binding protein [Pseudoalteromonas sp. DL2-H2.2]
MKLQTKLPLVVAVCTVALLGSYYLLSSFSANKAIIKFDSSALITLSRAFTQELEMFQSINAMEPLDSQTELITLLEQTYPNHYFILLINSKIAQNTFRHHGFELEVLISSPSHQFTVTDENKTLVMQAFMEPALVQVGHQRAQVLWFSKDILTQHSQDIDMRALLHKDFAYWLAILSLLAVIVSWLSAWYFLKPIKSLGRAFKQVESGDYHAELDHAGNDEFATLITRFNQMAAELAKTTAQRDQLTADLAHELRAPLTNLRARIEAIQDGMLPAEPVQFNRLIGQTVSIDNLIEDLHALSSGTAFVTTLDMQPQQPANLVKDLCEAYRPLVERNGMTLFCECTDNRKVMLDAQRLNQVLLNLIENAIKYAAQGGEIRLIVAPKESQLCIHVIDKGSGVDPNRIEDIFNRYYRDSGQQDTKGQGLGLDICARLIRQMDGNINIKSKPNEGACFTLTFTVLEGNHS